IDLREAGADELERGPLPIAARNRNGDGRRGPAQTCEAALPVGLRGRSLDRSLAPPVRCHPRERRGCTAAAQAGDTEHGRTTGARERRHQEPDHAASPDETSDRSQSAPTPSSANETPSITWP